MISSPGYWLTDENGMVARLADGGEEGVEERGEGDGGEEGEVDESPLSNAIAGSGKMYLWRMCSGHFWACSLNASANPIEETQTFQRSPTFATQRNPLSDQVQLSERLQALAHHLERLPSAAHKRAGRTTSVLADPSIGS